MTQNTRNRLDLENDKNLKMAEISDLTTSQDDTGSNNPTATNDSNNPATNGSNNPTARVNNINTSYLSDSKLYIPKPKKHRPKDDGHNSKKGGDRSLQPPHAPNIFFSPVL